jgi:hypothetical protein
MPIEVPQSASSGTVGVLDTVSSTTTVVNSTTETTVGSVTIPAGTITADTLFRLVVGGRVYNNSGSMNLTFRLKHGSTELVKNQTMTATASGSPRWWKAEFDIFCPTDQAQKISSFIYLGWPALSNEASNNNDWAGFHESTLDWSSDVTLDLSIQLSVANANAEADLRSAVLTVAGPLA